ncbi:MGMT family protein [Vagococcus entomophilus]|uniref:Cysteine methyltransferase n=1 Tax=Vagococcus entomophilus TaxID=1160095 RepID=A0A430AJZ3_9ENTE|nr:methylated-DNA--[protein]-cysteine S-methyltransferase [Vagococcus entomophilus]RSU08415.1 cysteine methyltransferase [Vagococcus entomophilus]
MEYFDELVYSVVSQVPYGKVVSYSQISWLLGQLNAARRVGRAMRHCPDRLPAHRVVRADGQIVGECAKERKQTLLAEEVIFKANEKIDMKVSSWDGKGYDKNFSKI